MGAGRRGVGSRQLVKDLETERKEKGMKKWRMAVVAATAVWAAAFCFGCAALSSAVESPEELAAQARRTIGTEAIFERLVAMEEQARMTYAFTWLSAERAGITETEARDWLAGLDGEEAEEEVEVPVADVDDVDFASLKWKFGGVDGSKAKLDSPRVSGAKATAKTLSYTWDVGLSGWGLANSVAGALACIFVEREDGELVGGKFEWTSTSRKTRSLSNVLKGYGGWSLEGVPNPCKCYYVVITEDGRKRSNVVSVGEWKR